LATPVNSQEFRQLDQTDLPDDEVTVTSIMSLACHCIIVVAFQVFFHKYFTAKHQRDSVDPFKKKPKEEVTCFIRCGAAC
jgi:hypothetical protein